MGKQKISAKIDEIAGRLNTKDPNNRIRRRIDKIRQEINADQNSTDTAQARREQTITNHQIGDSDVPIDMEKQKPKQISIRFESLRKLDKELRKAKQMISDFTSSIYGEDLRNSDIPAIDLNGYSDSAQSFKQQVSGIKDDFEFIVFDGQEPIYNQHISDIDGLVRINKQNLADFVEALDKVEDECRNASDSLSSLSVPNPEEVKEEIYEAEADRAREEYEAAEPFMNARLIKREFNTGEIFTAQELAQEMEHWGEGTAQSAIESVIEEDYDLGIESVEDGYRISDS